MKRIWDAPVRCLHWMLAGTIAAAWVTSSRIGPAHEVLGYATLAIVLARFAWGLKGNRYARFAHFVRPPAQTVRYLRAVAKGRGARHLGHNPLGGWMVVALLGCVALLGLTGWSATTDLLWGYAWPVRVHAALAWLLVILIVLHVGGVLLTSWQHRENLVVAMITGASRRRESATLTIKDGRRNGGRDQRQPRERRLRRKRMIVTHNRSGNPA